MACTTRTLKLGAKKAGDVLWELLLSLAVLAAVISVVVLILLDCAVGASLVSDWSLNAIYQFCHGTLLAGFEIPVFVAYVLINSVVLLGGGLTLLCAIGAEALKAEETEDSQDSATVIAENWELLSNAKHPATEVEKESESQVIACCALSKQGTLHLARPIAERQVVEEFCSVMGQQFLLICSPELQGEPQATQTSTVAFSAYQKGLNDAPKSPIASDSNGFNTGDAQLNELLSAVFAWGAGNATDDMVLSVPAKVAAVVTRLDC